MNVLLEFLFPAMTTLMNSFAESALRNENINVFLGNLSFHDVPIFLAAVISSVQYSNSIDLNDEHGCSHDMSGHVWGELDSSFFGLDSELDCPNSFHAVLDLLIVEESFIFLYFGGISDEVVVNLFGGSGHEYFLFVVVFG